jgi:hypothetical protein
MIGDEGGSQDERPLPRALEAEARGLHRLLIIRSHFHGFVTHQVIISQVTGVTVVMQQNKHNFGRF